MKIFETTRPHAIGTWAEDVVQVSTFSQKLRFGLVEKARYLIQGNGVFGLKWSRENNNHINQLLRDYRYPVIGIGLLVGVSEAYPYNGELILGGGSKLCQGIYEFVDINTQKYDGWIFDVKRFIFGEVTVTSEIPVTFALGQEFTLFPDELFTKIVNELGARQSNSQQATYYVRYNGIGFPIMGFETNGIILTMRPKDYLGKVG
uniref:Peptidase A1 domain-containing protein n=2 Tax=Bursaphelenchus xylophilus TaxID=6326 RepID=A0A1I7RWA6_BURXY